VTRRDIGFVTNVKSAIANNHISNNHRFASLLRKIIGRKLKPAGKPQENE